MILIPDANPLAPGSSPGPALIAVRAAAERGHFDHGWLRTWHTFSFGGYHDPRYMGFRALRVINEDVVQPGQGFGMHPHKDMEILTVVLSGSLEHRDSLGNGAVIGPGQVQFMSAGTGVRHSEVNPSATEPVHLLQIWILPARLATPPRYGERRFPVREEAGRLHLLACGDTRQGSIQWGQDALLWAGRFGPEGSWDLRLRPRRYGWLQVMAGALEVQGRTLVAGDGAAFAGGQDSSESVSRIACRAIGETEILFFDLV